MSKPLIVGLTGGIGSGKSAVAERLTAAGITVVDADIVARQVVEPGSSALYQISARFGQDILNADTSLNRGKLRELIFSDENQRCWLEQLLHPLIRTEIIRQLSTNDNPISVLASPLLLETDQRELVEYTVVVDVPEAVQLERTTQRDNNTREQVEAIMQAQISREKRLHYADWVVDNSGDLTNLDEQVDQLIQQLSQLAKQREKRE